jgi:hypothetical protein
MMRECRIIAHQNKGVIVFEYKRAEDGKTLVILNGKNFGHIVPVGTGAFFQSIDRSIKTKVFIDFLTCRKFVENQ